MIAASIDENYERIKADLVGRGLTYNRLIDDLLDHVCCLVEEYMFEGYDFESSYKQVLESIGEKPFRAQQVLKWMNNNLCPRLRT